MRRSMLAVMGLPLLLGACTGLPGHGDAEGAGGRSEMPPERFSFEDTASVLADREIFVQPIPGNREGIMPEQEFKARLDAQMSRRPDFRVLNVHAALVDTPNDHFNWSNEPMYVVEITGRSSHCFDFYDATSGAHRLSAC